MILRKNEQDWSSQYKEDSTFLVWRLNITIFMSTHGICNMHYTLSKFKWADPIHTCTKRWRKILASSCPHVFIITTNQWIIWIFVLQLISSLKCWLLACICTCACLTYFVQVNAAGDLCAICQEKMHAPIFLSCKHIFCEDCVAEWLAYLSFLT